MRAGDIDWLVSVDSTMVRAHQHAAGARKKGLQRENRMISLLGGPAAG